MIIDIDHFKRFNDTWGHLIGDKVLVHTARIFERSVRNKIDTVARYGGEEFAVILPETPLHGAKRFAERLKNTTASSSLEVDGNLLSITVSIGVACTSVTKCSKPSDLVAAADAALYKAKEAGRNRVEIFEREFLENV